MADDRTPDQRLADDALQEAIERVHAAYAPERSSRTVLTQWLISTCRSGINDEGDDETYVDWIVSQPPPALHSTYGLAEHTAARLRARIQRDDD